MLKSKKTVLPLVLSATLLLQSCAGLIIGAGVGAVSVAHDRRTIGTQVDDTTTASRISIAMLNDTAIKEQTSISVQVFNGTALLVGQAPTQALMQQAEKLASSVKNIKKLHRAAYSSFGNRYSNPYCAVNKGNQFEGGIPDWNDKSQNPNSLGVKLGKGGVYLKCHTNVMFYWCTQ